jgi:hypothetical protein
LLIEYLIAMITVDALENRARITYHAAIRPVPVSDPAATTAGDQVAEPIKIEFD